MTIDIQALELGDPVHIGATDKDKLIVGDSLKATFYIAEGMEQDGTPVVPALFATDNGGWTAAIEIDGNPFAASITPDPLEDSGEITINIAPDLTTAGRFEYLVRVLNASIPAKRYILHGTIVVRAKHG
jgi:hypothetical protein